MTKYDIAIFVTIAAAVALLLQIIQEAYYSKKRREVEEIYEHAIKTMSEKMEKKYAELPHKVFLKPGEDPSHGHQIAIDELPTRKDGNQNGHIDQAQKVL